MPPRIELSSSVAVPHRTVTGAVGHNLPQEVPRAFAEAVMDVDGY
jgi:hypothetical protein